MYLRRAFPKEAVEIRAISALRSSSVRPRLAVALHCGVPLVRLILSLSRATTSRDVNSLSDSGCFNNLPAIATGLSTREHAQRMIAHTHILLLMAIASSVVVSAQSPDTTSHRLVSGVIVDATTDKSVVGATIRLYARTESTDGATWLEPTGKGTIARDDGGFTIAVPRSGTFILQATSVGYQTARVEVTGAVITVRMTPLVRQNSAITVTGVRTSRSVEDACCRVESIRDEVQQHAPFSPGVDQVLRRYSSCTSSRIACAIDGAGSIRLRGLEPSSTRVLIDGAPVMGGLSTFYGLALIPAHALQTIRIVEGASSGEYGNGAVSGVIDLLIRPPTEESEFQGSATITGGGNPFEHLGVNVGWTGMIDNAGIAAFGSVSAARDNLPHVVEPQSRKAAAVTRGNVMIDASTEMIVTFLGGLEERRGSAIPTDERGVTFTEEINIGRGDAALQLSRTLDDASSLSLALHTGTFSLEGSYGATPIDARQRLFYGRCAWTRNIVDHRLTLGVEYFDDRAREQAFGEIDYDVTVASLYAQNEWNVSDTWGLLGSVRFDHHSGPGGIVTPRGAVRWSPAEDLTMRFMAGAGFKGEALFNEEHLTLHRNVRWRTNPAYDFERSFTLNFDVSHDIPLGHAGKVEANFNAYLTTLSNTPTPNLDSLAQGTLFMVNRAEPSRLRGMEVQTRWTVSEQWSGSIAVAAIDYARTMADGRTAPVPLAPSMNIDASVLFHDDEGGWTIEAWGSHIGRQTLPVNPWGMTSSPAYTIVNARLERSFGPVSVFVGLQNVLDAEQLDTTPLSIDLGNGEHDGGIVWGSVEGREFFAGVRWGR